MEKVVALVFALGMLANAGLFVPQAWRLWKTKNAENVSIVSFAGFCALQLVGSVHGYLQHDHALLAGMLASLLTCGTVTLLALRYTPRARQTRKVTE